MISETRSFGNGSLAAAIRRAQFGTYCRFQDIEGLMRAIYRTSPLSNHQFEQVKRLLENLVVIDHRAQFMIADFAKLTYRAYIHKKLTKQLGLTTLGEKSTKAAIDYKADHIPIDTGANRRPKIAMSPKYLTIHSTGNPKSSAKGERAWLTNPENKRTASFHIVVDELAAIECIPLTEVAWHAGDGTGSLSGNKTSISLEICESGDRAKTLVNAAHVAASTLSSHGIPLANLRRHHDWSGKNCPRILIDESLRAEEHQTWEWFVSQVQELHQPSVKN